MASGHFFVRVSCFSGASLPISTHILQGFPHYLNIRGMNVSPIEGAFRELRKGECSVEDDGWVDGWMGGWVDG